MAKIDMAITTGSREVRRTPGAGLKFFMDERGLKANAWAKRADVTPATLYNFINGKSHSLSSDTVVRLARAAELEPAALFDCIFGDGELDRALRKTSDLSEGVTPVIAVDDDSGDEQPAAADAQPVVDDRADNGEVDLPLEDVTDTIRAMAERAADREGMSLKQFVSSAIASHSLRTIRPPVLARDRSADGPAEGFEDEDRFAGTWSGTSPSLPRRNRRNRRYV